VLTGAAGVLLGLGVLLRAEGLLAAGAMVIVLGVVSVRRRSRVFGLATALMAVLVVLSVGVLRVWTRAIVGASSEVTDRTSASPFLTGRLSGSWISLLRPISGPGVSVLAGLAGLLAVLVAGWAGWKAGRRHAGRTEIGVLLAVAVALTLIQYALAPGALVSGLLSAWPISGFAIGLFLARREKVEERLLLGFAAVFAAAVLATQYANGGGAQWGGRYLMPVVVPICAVLAIELTRVHFLRHRSVLVPLVALAVIPSLAGLLAVRTLRADHQALLAPINEAPASVVVTDLPWWPRASWQFPETEWLLVRGEDPEVVARQVASRRDGPVGVLRSEARATPPDGVDLTPDDLRELGAQYLEVDP
jgi:hypothetical protein